MIKTLYTANYGIVTVTDVMVDPDGTNLVEGINIHDEDGTLLAEVANLCSDDVTDGDDAEMYIENFEVD